MIRWGILGEDDPVELLEGWLIPKMPKNPPHRASTKLTRNALEAIIPNGWYVDAQEPITLDNSEPEPDIVIVKGDTRDYLDRHPGASDLALVVEIADSTLERDRTLKKRIYARAGISVYWIVNLIDKQLEVYTQPIDIYTTPTYQQFQDYKLSEQVSVFIDDSPIGSLTVQEVQQKHEFSALNLVKHYSCSYNEISQ
ncbi:MAG: Uma2 family endonuclease [Moorea sp. SIO1G6]|nr:Uma2 family endonuclease [Moorena sp. SIO3B2]NEP65398.1 Uma2 family endonuclease [Moorena sp. SIO3A5]NEQ05767.1 Uma2 family endonuclease [Moorena sp. SIO4E2]NEQ13610.1 Uma2 family endonuclease [Moorena sp. SIO3E2]NER88242.1 Uma2 family endonuclease [Moorena sp. SIO3A2]NES43596.1 Uma2 family endonuclease [Moorena sp. SIO2C4]NET65418.1 Uma2 family endonuclease [Moorena sp. SIO1G6]